MFTYIKSLIPKRNSQMSCQRRETLNRLKDFDYNFEDDELNLKKENTSNVKKKKKKRKNFRNIP